MGSSTASTGCRRPSVALNWVNVSLRHASPRRSPGAGAGGVKRGGAVRGQGRRVTAIRQGSHCPPFRPVPRVAQGPLLSPHFSHKRARASGALGKSQLVLPADENELTRVPPAARPLCRQTLRPSCGGGGGVPRQASGPRSAPGPPDAAAGGRHGGRRPAGGNKGALRGPWAVVGLSAAANYREIQRGRVRSGGLVAAPVPTQRVATP